MRVAVMYTPARLESRTVRTRRSWRQDRPGMASIDNLTVGDPADQPDQSQPRRRNNNTRRTPTMSISTSTAG